MTLPNSSQFALGPRSVRIRADTQHAALAAAAHGVHGKICLFRSDVRADARNRAERPLVRNKPVYDGTESSGNAVAVMNLLRLHELTGEEAYRRRAEKAFAAFSNNLPNRILTVTRTGAELTERAVQEPRQR